MRTGSGFRFLGFASAVVVSLAIAAAAQSAKQGFDPSALTGSIITDAHRLSLSEGWASTPKHLLWTNTAGQTWTEITPPLTVNQDIESTYFLDSSHGWILLSTRDPKYNGVAAVGVASTEDGGKTWSLHPVSIPFDLGAYAGGSFSFADGMHGWLQVGIAGSSASSRARPLATTDGGKTWTALPKELPVRGEIQWLSQFTGWLRGGISDTGLYRTHDGGQTWTIQTVTLPDGVEPYSNPDYGPSFVVHPSYLSVFFEDPQNGILALSVSVAPPPGSSPEAKGRPTPIVIIYQTKDGGDSWQVKKVESQPHRQLAAFDSTFLEIEGPDPKGGLSLYLNSKATSGKLTPDLRPTQAQQTRGFLVLKKANFLDAEHGWILLGRGSYCAGVDCQSALVGTEDGKTFATLLKAAKAAKPAAVPERSGDPLHQR